MSTFQIGDFVKSSITSNVGKIISNTSNHTFIAKYQDKLDYVDDQLDTKMKLKYNTANDVVEALLIYSSFSNLFEELV